LTIWNHLIEVRVDSKERVGDVYMTSMEFDSKHRASMTD
jgi:hypothetical protein